MRIYDSKTIQTDLNGAPQRQGLLTMIVCLSGAILTGLCGCSAMHPIRGVPAAYLPDQFIGPSRDNKRTIDLSMLVRTPPDQYRLASGDVISVFVPRVLGTETTEANTVGISPPINMPSSVEDPPTVGYPIPVRDDNTISLPQVPPINVGGMTLDEAEKAIFSVYTEQHKILNPSEALVMVSLQRPRVTRVLVVRQEATTSLTPTTGAGSVNIGTSGKGTARTVTLKAYENDVLHALARADGVDGLPGLNAENVIYIIRRRPKLASAPFCPTGPRPTIAPGMAPPALPQPAYDHSQPGLIMPQMPQAGQQRQQAPHRVTQATGNAAANGVRIQTVAYEQPSREQPFAGYRHAAGHSVSMTPPQAQPTPTNAQVRTSYRDAFAPQSPMARVDALSNAQRGPRLEQGIQQIQYEQIPQGQIPLPPVAPQVQSYENSMGHSFGGMAAPQANSLPMAIPEQPIPAYSGTEYSAPVEKHWSSMLQNFDPTIDNPNVIRIPVRLGPGEVPQITEDSIILNDGDIIFIESRETEVFYTAGLLGGGQYTLPRDYDLGVVEAVSIAESRSTSGGSQMRAIGGVSALNSDVSTSASRLAILRTLPNGKRITIEVDLRKAMRYQEENIRIQPADVLVLQYTMPEAISAYTQRYLLEGALFGVAAGTFTQGR